MLSKHKKYKGDFKIKKAIKIISMLVFVFLFVSNALGQRRAEQPVEFKKTVDQVIEGIRKITDKPVKYLANTHSDGDYVEGNMYFPQTVTFIAHENCRKDFFRPGRNGAPYHRLS